MIYHMTLSPFGYVGGGPMSGGGGYSKMVNEEDQHQL